MAKDESGPVAKVFNGCLNAVLLIVVLPIVLIAALISNEMEEVPADMQAWETYAKNAYQVSKPDHLNDFGLLKSLAEAGDSEAQYWLATAYSNGDGVIKNYTDAFNLFGMSADNGNIHSIYQKGVALCMGRGVDPNKFDGLSLLKSTASHSPDTAIAIGVLTELGHCSEENTFDGKSYFDLAVQLGGIEYTDKIGYIFAKGKGLPKDQDKATYWYRSGAIAGNKDLQSTLGYFLAGKTLGETEKMIAPYAWLAMSLSGSNDFSPAQIDGIQSKLSSLEKDMTSEQVSRAQNLAKQCLNTGYTNCPF